MKYKWVYIILIVLVIIVTIKYYISDYDIKYKIENNNIEEIYENKKFSFVVQNENYYVIELYGNRSVSKKKIKSIEKKEFNNYICYKTNFNKSFLLNCFDKEQNAIEYYLINDEDVIKYLDSLELNTYKHQIENENFKFFNNLDENTYIALWTYKGFYIMHDNKIDDLELFENEKYDNSLCFNIDEYLILPNYDTVHEYKSFYKINMVNTEYSEIKLKDTINNDSYVVGINKNKGYIFDNKYNNLYEVNINKKSIELIGNENKGYIKYLDGKKTNSSLKEYKNKITYFPETKSNFEIQDGLYRVYNDNYKIKIFDNSKVQIVKESNDSIYFVFEDDLYFYNNEGLKKIFHYFELNFNSKNLIYIYMK